MKRFRRAVALYVFTMSYVGWDPRVLMDADAAEPPTSASAESVNDAPKISVEEFLLDPEQQRLHMVLSYPGGRVGFEDDFIYVESPDGLLYYGTFEPGIGSDAPHVLKACANLVNPKTGEQRNVCFRSTIEALEGVDVPRPRLSANSTPLDPSELEFNPTTGTMDSRALRATGDQRTDPTLGPAPLIIVAFCILAPEVCAALIITVGAIVTAIIVQPGGCTPGEPEKKVELPDEHCGIRENADFTVTYLCRKVTAHLGCHGRYHGMGRGEWSVDSVERGECKIECGSARIVR